MYTCTVHDVCLYSYDFLQLPECIYMVTEEATPLETHLQTEEGQSEHAISWGLHQIIVRENYYVSL